MFSNFGFGLSLKNLKSVIPSWATDTNTSEAETTATTVSAPLLTTPKFKNPFENISNFQVKKDFVPANLDNVPLRAVTKSFLVRFPNDNENLATSCNKTFKVTKKTNQNTQENSEQQNTPTHILKIIISDSKEPPKDSVMYEIEAYMAHVFRWLGPGLAPNMITIIDESGKSIGILSEIFDFVSFKKANLTKEQLNQLLKNKLFARNMQRSNLINILIYNDDAHQDNKGINIKESDIENIDKIIGEVDARDVDFDMGGWPISCFYKYSNIYEKVLKERFPNEGFSLTAKDIRITPLFENPKRKTPYYYPGKDLPENYITMIKGILSLDKNAYPPLLQEFFAQLSKVDNESVLFQCLKFALTDRTFYHNLACQYIRQTRSHGDQKMVDAFADMFAYGIENIRNQLYTMPEFLEYLQNSGEKALAEIIDEIEKENAAYTAEINKAHADHQKKPTTQTSETLHALVSYDIRVDIKTIKKCYTRIFDNTLELNKTLEELTQELRNVDKKEIQQLIADEGVDEFIKDTLFISNKKADIPQEEMEYEARTRKTI